jgi:hypothetical protein
MSSALQITVDKVFGQDVVSVNDNGCDSSPIGAALAKARTYPLFHANFSSRLRRLKAAYRGHESELNLHTMVAELGSPSNWQGALAEIAAVDFFCFASGDFEQVPRLNVDLPAGDSVAGDLGMQVANVDLSFRCNCVYSDVKVLKDNVTEILSGVIKRLGAAAPPAWQAEFPFDSGYSDLRSSLASVEKELKAATDCGKQPDEVNCTSIVPGLKLRFQWSSGILMTETKYNPYQHAKSTAELPVIHSKKFVKTDPFFLTFVTHPFFNNVVPPIQGTNLQYYRAMARRAFLDAKRLSEPFNTVHSGYSGVGLVGDFIKHLGGLLFLEDHSPDGETPSASNVRAYYYENPRAPRKPSNCGLFREFLDDVGIEVFDDFEHDLY